MVYLYMNGYIAYLSDGSVRDEYMLGWLQLKEHLTKNNLKIVALELQYDHQRVYCKRNASVYFYKKKVEAWRQGGIR